MNYTMFGRKNGRVVKGINFVDLKDADPVNKLKFIQMVEQMKFAF